MFVKEFATTSGREMKKREGGNVKKNITGEGTVSHTGREKYRNQECSVEFVVVSSETFFFFFFSCF